MGEEPRAQQGTGFGHAFLVIASFLLFAQGVAVADAGSHIPFGYLLLFAILTYGCTAVGVALVLPAYGKDDLERLARWALVATLFSVLVLVYAIFSELDGSQDVWFWEYVFLLGYAVSFAAAGITATWAIEHLEEG